MDVKQHRVVRRLISYDLALHPMDSGTGAHGHAAAEEDLDDEDGDQNVGVLLNVFIFLCFTV